MRIAILGSRGIPANYSGFETCAEELAVRLVERGHSVSVYCCRPYSHFPDEYYKGVKRIVLPTIRTKSLEKIFHAALSLIHVAVTNTDVVLVLGLNIPLFCWLPRILGKKVFINVDGLEWKRKKWGVLASKYLLWSERMAALVSHCLITDARCIETYYLEKYQKKSTFIAYGAETKRYPPGEMLKKYGLEKDGYIFYVARFEPENNPLLVREAYDMLKEPHKKLVMVGDSQFSRKYVENVRNTTNPNIFFTGFLFGDGYREVASNAYLYIQASEVGGTHPALVEAMGFGNFILANDVPEHREVLRDAGVYYKGKEELSAKMEYFINHPESVNRLKRRTQEIVRKEYSWEDITSKYENLFKKMVKR